VEPDEYGNFTIELFTETDRYEELLDKLAAGTITARENAELNVLLGKVTLENGEIKHILYDTGYIGIVIVTRDMDGCSDPYEPLNAKIKHGREGYGLAVELPLDDMIPLDESSSSSEF